jgi:hypothetical protein
MAMDLLALVAHSRKLILRPHDLSFGQGHSKRTSSQSVRNYGEADEVVGDLVCQHEKS